MYIYIYYIHKQDRMIYKLCFVQFGRNIYKKFYKTFVIYNSK